MGKEGDVVEPEDAVRRDSIVRLRPRARLTICPTAPFNFLGTVWKPSHFPSPLEGFDGRALRFTINRGDDVFGIRLTDVSVPRKPAVQAIVFANRRISEWERAQVSVDLRWMFDLDADLSEFERVAAMDPALRRVVKRWSGMRIKCLQDLYGLLVVSVVLQNATVRRSVNMLDRLIREYGTFVEFDGVRLGTLWAPSRLENESEERLRALRVGYRARTLIRQARDAMDVKLEERRLRTLADGALREELLSVYGVGPASVGILAFEAFHRYDWLDHLGPWESQIFSTILLGKSSRNASGVLRRAGRWKPWRMLALHYLFEDLFWRHRRSRVKWLESLIRL